MSIDYPVTFPCASRVEGHSADLFTGVVRTPMQAGNSRQRRSHHALPHQISLVFIVKQTAYAEWLKWVNEHAWDEWVSMNLPGLAASDAGVNTAPILVRFCTDLSTELLDVFRLWYWRVRVDCEYMPDPELLAPPPPPLQLSAQWNTADQGRQNRTLTFANNQRIAIRSAPVTANGGSVRAVKSNGGSGKYYVELEPTAFVASPTYWSFGLLSAGITLDADPTNEASVGYLVIFGNGAVYYDLPGGGATPLSLGTMTGTPPIADGDKIGLAWTVGTGVDIYRNGALVKSVAYTSTAQHFPWFGQGNTVIGATSNTPGATCTLRAIPLDFAYPPPAGFTAWAPTETTYTTPTCWDLTSLVQSAAGTLSFVELDRRAIKDASGTNYAIVRAIAGAAKSAGKWYFEVHTVVPCVQPFANNAGVCKLDAVLAANWTTQAAGSVMFNNGQGQFVTPGSAAVVSGKVWGTVHNHCLGICYEPGVSFATTLDGSVMTATVALGAGNWVPCIGLGWSSAAAQVSAADCSLRIRTGSDLWYAPPAGYTALS